MHPLKLLLKFEILIFFIKLYVRSQRYNQTKNKSNPEIKLQCQSQGRPKFPFTLQQSNQAMERNVKKKDDVSDFFSIAGNTMILHWGALSLLVDFSFTVTLVLDTFTPVVVPQGPQMPLRPADPLRPHIFRWTWARGLSDGSLGGRGAHGFLWPKISLKLRFFAPETRMVEFRLPSFWLSGLFSGASYQFTGVQIETYF